MFSTRLERPLYSGVAHEIHRPGMVQLCRCLQGHDLALRYPLLGPTHLIELAYAIYAVDPFVMPRVSQGSKPGKALPEAPPSMLRHDGLQRRDDGRIRVRLRGVHLGYAIEGGPRQPRDLTRPLDGEAMASGRDRHNGSPGGPRYSFRVSTSLMAVSSSA
jgi:hypothetical protein